MATKNLETVSGTVEQINAKQTGIKVNGQWLNISQYHPIAVLPQAGQHVQVEVEVSDRGMWINSLHVLDGAPSLTSISSSSPSTRDRTITKLAVLKAASNFLGLMGQSRVEVKAEHVLVLASYWLAWVERTDKNEEDEQF